MRVSRKGFTLIELIVVIIIIGILASVSLSMMTGNIKKAKKSEAIAALGTLRTAAGLFYLEKSRAPTKNDIVGPDTGYLYTADLDGIYYLNSGYRVSGNLIIAYDRNNRFSCYINWRNGYIYINDSL